MLKTLKKVDDVLGKIEFVSICLFLTAMLCFCFVLVILRNIFGSGSMPMDALAKDFVLWITLLGAAMAVKNRRNLNIEVLNRLVPESKKKYLKVLLSLMSMLVCIAVGTASALFIDSEKESRDMVLWNLPVIIIEMILPIGYALISLHFLTELIEDLEKLLEKGALRTVLEILFIGIYIVSLIWNLLVLVVWNVWIAGAHGHEPIATPLGALFVPSVTTGLLVLIGVLAFLGLPLFVVFAGLAMLAYVTAELPIAVLPGEIMRITSLPPMIMIPLFTFAGCVMAESGMPKRLVALSRALLGWMPGGLGLVCLIACAFFTAFTGASGVTIIAVGGLLMPALIQERYKENFALGLLTTSGSLGMLFPPSLAIILYGTLAKVNIDTLFKAAFVPGLFLMVLIGGYIGFTARKLKLERQAFSWAELHRSAREGIWELLLPLLVFLGVYGPDLIVIARVPVLPVVIGGLYVFHVVETIMDLVKKPQGWKNIASAICGFILLPFILFGLYALHSGGRISLTDVAVTVAFYVLVVELLVHRDVHIKKDVPRIMRESMVLIGGVLIILASALGLTNFLIDQEVPDKIFAFLSHYISGKHSFLIVLNIFFLIMGAMLDIFSAVIVVPLICPIALNYGINPIHLGVIFLTNLEIGYSFPPAGLNLFISSFRFKQPITKLYVASLPFILLYFLALAFITYVPEISLIAVNP